MARNHTCTHPSGKSHVCSCRIETSHASFQNQCARYDAVTRVDPLEEGNHFVKVVEMPGQQVAEFPKDPAVLPFEPPSVFLKMNGQWVEYIPKPTVS